MTAKLFYIDDEPRPSSLYCEELEREYDVVYIRNVDDIDALEQRVISDGPSLIIQDVMMPPPGGDGIDVRAGIRIAERLKETLHKLRIPVILFSNRVSNDLRDEATALGYKAAMLSVLFKPTTGFAQLRREVAKALADIQKV